MPWFGQRAVSVSCPAEHQAAPVLMLRLGLRVIQRQVPVTVDAIRSNGTEAFLVALALCPPPPPSGAAGVERMRRR